VSPGAAGDAPEFGANIAAITVVQIAAGKTSFRDLIVPPEMCNPSGAVVLPPSGLIGVKMIDASLDNVCTYRTTNAHIAKVLLDVCTNRLQA
jgi:hypothetical protein